MSEIEQRSYSKRSHHTSRSKSKDSDGGRDCYQSRQSKSHSKASKSKKKKSKKKRFRRSSSSSSSTSKNSSRSLGCLKSSSTNVCWPTQPPSIEENIQANASRNTAIELIEMDSFTAETFYRTADKKIPEKVIIDLKNETISVERNVDGVQPEQSLIFHPNCLGDDKRKIEKWIKKLYNYRLKSYQD